MLNQFSLLTLVSACLVLAGSAAAWASTTCAIEPSFDCSRAGNEVEQLVCSNNTLAELDNQLAGVYQTALENFPAAELSRLQDEQRDWLKERNGCGTSEDAVRCVRHAYESRITLLQIQGGLLTVPEPVQYSCSSGKYDYLTAIFYNQTALPAVVLTGNTDRDNWQYILMLSPSGSGAKYTGPGMLFWSKGDECIIEQHGKTTTCSTLNK